MPTSSEIPQALTRRRLLAGIAACLVLCLNGPAARSAEPASPRLSAELIWGTNGAKPADREYKPIAPDLDRKLRRIFKWRNYFRIEHKEFAVPPQAPARVDMSKECRLEVRRIPGGEFEIQLFGKGVLVVKKRQRIIEGETVVLGGDDKNDDAWFVVLTLARSAKP